MQWMQVQEASCGRRRDESERQVGRFHPQGIGGAFVRCTLVTLPGERCVESANQEWSLGSTAMIALRRVRE